MTRIQPPKENHLNSLCINLTNKCNTWCKYCFQNACGNSKDRLSVKDIERILSYFNRFNTGNRKYLQLTGGEPTIHPDFFNILDTTLQHGYKLRLQTNGISFAEMPEEQLAKLSSHDILIKISLDGWEADIHEYLRAKGSFEKVLTGIRRLAKVNRNIALKTVVHKKNIDEIYRMLDMCIQLGARGFSYNILRTEGAAEQSTEAAISELLVAKKLLPKFNQSRYRHLLNGNNILSYWLTPTTSTPRPGSFYIDFDGGIFPNQKCTPSSRIGSVFGANLDKEFDPNKLRYPEMFIQPELFNYVKNNLITTDKGNK